jgi:hypothetical protein
MSSNLTPEARAKQNEYLNAKTLEDRIEKLEEFISLIPKHKATENMVAVYKTRLSKLREEKDERDQRLKDFTGYKEDPFAIKREPHTIQVILLSDFFENEDGVGKTTIIKKLTGVSDGTIGLFTPEPVIGIYEWEKAKFQIVEEPALHESSYLSRQMGGIRNADLILLTVDLSRDPIKQVENVISILEDNDIFLNHRTPPIKFEKTGAGGIQLFFLSNKARECEDRTEFIKQMVKEAGISNGIIKIYDKITTKDIEVAFNRGSVFLSGAILGTKADLPGSKQSFEKLLQKYKKPEQKANDDSNLYFTIIPIAVKHDESNNEIIIGTEKLGEQIIREIDYIRVYTKSKKGVSEKPLLMPRESTISDVALKIHKDLYNSFKFAIVYRYQGSQRKIRAGLNFQIQDHDVIELFSSI